MRTIIMVRKLLMFLFITAIFSCATVNSQKGSFSKVQLGNGGIAGDITLFNNNRCLSYEELKEVVTDFSLNSSFVSLIIRSTGREKLGIQFIYDGSDMKALNDFFDSYCDEKGIQPLENDYGIVVREAI